MPDADHLERTYRREATRIRAAPAATADATPGQDETDELLSLIFACCHPALPRESQIALTLRTVGGLTTAEIAAAFLATEPAMAQRLSRARKTLRETGAEVRIPSMPPGQPGPVAGRPR